MIRGMRLGSVSLLFALGTLGCKPADTGSTKAVQAGAPAQAALDSGSREWKIANAESAGPAAIASAATIMDWPATPNGKMTQLRAGSNGWTCLPDTPGTPTNDPICMDDVWQKWGDAWMAHKPFSTKVGGLAYMLQGASDASNTDPFKTAPDSGQAWVTTGPHVMLLYPDAASIAALPTDYHAGGPFVMFKGTPYAHVMMPVAK